MAKRRRPPPPEDSDDRVKFPFGESSGSREGHLFADSEELDSEDLDSDDLDPEDFASDESLFGSDSSDSLPARKRLPATPPDSAPSDEYSFESIDVPIRDVLDSDEASDGDRLTSSEEAALMSASSEELVDLDSSDVKALISISERIGPVNPSGPLVIVEEDESSIADSIRYQASIVDDSARLAGSVSTRAPLEDEDDDEEEPSARSRKRGKKKTKKKKKKTRTKKTKRPSGRSRKSSWREESVVPDESEEVPFPERRARPRTPPPRAPSKIPWVLALVAILGAVGVGVALETRRKADLQAQRDDYEERLGDAKLAREQALAEQKTAHLGELTQQSSKLKAEQGRMLEQAERKIADAVETARVEEREAARKEAERAAAAEREQAEQAAAEALDVRLARAREDQARASQEAIEAAVKEALAKARAEAEAALEELKRREDRRRRDELERLRKRMEKEVAAAAATRKAEDDLAESIVEDKSDMLDSVEKGEGGSVSKDVDDWDEFFEDDGGGGDGGSSSEDGDDPFDDEEGSGEQNLVEKAWSWLRENVHGRVGYKNLSHFSTGEFHDARQTRHEMRLELEYREWIVQNEEGSMGLKLVLGADVRVDDDDYAVQVLQSIDDEERRRPILTADESYLALALDWFELRGGWQVYSWGSGDLFNPTNNLNPVDFSDLFDARRIPVMAITAAAEFEYIALEVHSIPSFTRSRAVLKGKRFDELRTSPVPILRPDDPEFSGESMQWAGRISTSVKGWDLSVSGFRGYNDLPQPRFVLLDPNDPATLAVDPTFEQMNVIGADFATTLGIFGAEGTLGEVLGGIQIHGEVAHFWNDSEFADDYAQYVVGLNYQFVDLIAEHDVTIIIEYTGEFVTAATDNPLDEIQIDRALRGAILARLVYEVNEDLTFEVNAAVVTHGDHNALIHPAARYNVTENLEVELSGDIFLGPEETFFGQYQKDGRVIFQLSFLF